MTNKYLMHTQRIIPSQTMFDHEKSFTKKGKKPPPGPLRGTLLVLVVVFVWVAGGVSCCGFTLLDMDGAGGFLTAFRAAMSVGKDDDPELEDSSGEPGSSLLDDRAYMRQWAQRDAELQAAGFPPSKLGPGVPAQTFEPDALGSMLGMKARAWDDSGIEIPYKEDAYPNDNGFRPGG